MLPVRVRDLRPADAPLVGRLHAALTPRSRYQRYHGAKPVLTRREAAYLAGTDGRDHVALVALDRTGAPVGIARYVRCRQARDTADVAAEVADPWQHQGLGSDLVVRLAPRAAAAGVRRFTATVLSETRLPAALARHGWRVASFDGVTTTLAVDLRALVRGAAVAPRGSRRARRRGARPSGLAPAAGRPRRAAPAGG